jgi:hypothetical protein
MTGSATRAVPQLSALDLLAVRACQYVLHHREPRRPAATGQRRTSRLLLLGHGDGETRRQWRSGVRQPRLPRPAKECRSPRDQKQPASDLSDGSASAKEQTRSSRDGAFAAAAAATAVSCCCSRSELQAGAGLNRRSVVSASRAERQYVLSTGRTAVARPNGANGRRPDLCLAGGAWVVHPADLAVGATSRRLPSSISLSGVGRGRLVMRPRAVRIPGVRLPAAGEVSGLVTAFVSQRGVPRREAGRWSSRCVREPLGRSVR